MILQEQFAGKRGLLQFQMDYLDFYCHFFFAQKFLKFKLAD